MKTTSYSERGFSMPGTTDEWLVPGKVKTTIVDELAMLHTALIESIKSPVKLVSIKTATQIQKRYNARLQDGTLPVTFKMISYLIARPLSKDEKTAIATLAFAESSLLPEWIHSIYKPNNTAGMFQLRRTTRDDMAKEVTAYLKRNSQAKTDLANMIPKEAPQTMHSIKNYAFDTEDESEGYWNWVLLSAWHIKKEMEGIEKSWTFTSKWNPIGVSNPAVLQLVDKYPFVFSDYGSGLQALFSLAHVNGPGIFVVDKKLGHPTRVFDDIAVFTSLKQEI